MRCAERVFRSVALAWSRAQQAVGLLGLPGDLNSVSDPAARDATYLLVAELAFQLGFRRKSLSPELGRLDLYEQSDEAARSAGKFYLANAIRAIGAAEQSKGLERLTRIAAAIQEINTAREQLPAWEEPEFLDKRKIELRSSVLGCIITAELPNQNRSLFLTEALLAALEAFLATSLNTDLLPYTAKLRVKIIPCDFLAKPLEWTILEGQSLVEVRHSTDEAADVHLLQDLLA